MIIDNNKKKYIAQFSVLLAIEVVFCVTPLGSLPAFGPMVATLAMIPIIITAFLLGTKASVVIGAFTGLLSFLVWTFAPPTPALAFVFTPFSTFSKISGNFGSVLICFVPRILVGIVTSLSYNLLKKRWPTRKTAHYMFSAIFGSLTNTLGVIFGLWLFFGRQYSVMFEESMWMIAATIILTNGIPEAAISAVTATAVCKPF